MRPAGKGAPATVLVAVTRAGSCPRVLFFSIKASPSPAAWSGTGTMPAPVRAAPAATLGGDWAARIPAIRVSTTTKATADRPGAEPRRPHVRGVILSTMGSILPDEP